MLKLQFFLALVVAAVDALWQQAKGIWVAMGTKQRVSDELKAARLEVCPGCDIFYPALRTCGSPLKKHNGPGIRPGCFCQMDVASGQIHDCWKFEMGREGGWPKELNSSYILQHEQREPESN